MTRNTGRIWGYLLLTTEPASLDRIADALGIAKSGVSVATRHLVSVGLARGIRERGGRRLLYEALDDLEGMFAGRNAALTALRQTLRRGADAVPDGPGRQRLDAMADMLQELVDMVPAFLKQMRETRDSPERRRA